MTENIRNFVITAHIDPHTKRGARGSEATPRYGVGVDHTKRGARGSEATPRYGVGVDHGK